MKRIEVAIVILSQQHPSKDVKCEFITMTSMLEKVLRKMKSFIKVRKSPYSWRIWVKINQFRYNIATWVDNSDMVTMPTIPLHWDERYVNL